MTQFGWKKDPFNPRALYLRHWARHEGIELKVLDHVDLRHYTDGLGLPWDQGNKGACTGFGIAVNLSARAVEQKVFNKLNQRFSPEWIYDGERSLEGTLDEDSGAYPEDGFLWVERHGCLPESYLPYTDKLLTNEPIDNPEAWKWPELTHYRVDEGIRGLQAALSVGNFISIGIPFWADWMYPPDNGILPDVNEDSDLAGGHEMCLFGYFHVGTGKKLYFICINSWGIWGDGGWCYIPAEAFPLAKIMYSGYDAHFPRLPWKITT